MSTLQRAFANPMPDGLATLQRPGTGALRAVFGATLKTATGTVALPSKDPIGARAQAPAKGNLGWTNGPEESFEEVVKSAQAAAVRMLVY
jgi:hypothetical protein